MARQSYASCLFEWPAHQRAELYNVLEKYGFKPSETVYYHSDVYDLQLYPDLPVTERMSLRVTIPREVEDEWKYTKVILRIGHSPQLGIQHTVCYPRSLQMLIDMIDATLSRAKRKIENRALLRDKLARRAVRKAWKASQTNQPQ